MQCWDATASLAIRLHVQLAMQIERNEQRAVQLGQGVRRERTTPSPQSVLGERADLLTQRDRVHVESAIRRMEEYLTRIHAAANARVVMSM